ncbi:MAG TPA: DUF308 domain-containing protein [Candidatus Limnocylindrales bacterium]|jgi:uncharacterized membrane protein HdeD (DUF308 family)|nr:DUF308 domain-containing protein [Candidatus Limnocylindrales bacterium]
MLASAARQWWVLVVEGVLGVIFGVLALLLPGVTLLTLAYLFAAWAIISGVTAIGEGMRVADQRGRSWPFAVTGVVSIVAGVLAALLPGPTIGGLMLFLGAWLVVGGVAQLWAAYQIRKVIDNEWIIALAGVLRAVAGLIILAFPIVGALLTVAYISSAAIIVGVIAIALGFRLRGLRSSPLGRGAAAM